MQPYLSRLININALSLGQPLACIRDASEVPPSQCNLLTQTAMMLMTVCWQIVKVSCCTWTGEGKGLQSGILGPLPHHAVSGSLSLHRHAPAAKLLLLLLHLGGSRRLRWAPLHRVRVPTC